MSAYLYPIRTAILIFPILALVLTLPFMIGQYRRYGSVVFWRAVVVYTFIFYLLTAYFLIILPLPSAAAVAKMTGPKYNLVPFMALREFINTTPFQFAHPTTWLAALKAPGFIQPAFNITLTLPFGVYLRYYFKRPLWQVIGISFALSLFFELTQLSGLYGYYPRPYRLFDVDDLILNTTGGLIGGLVAPALMRVFPSRDAMDKESVALGTRVTWPRRFVAFLVDYVVMGVIVGAAIAFIAFLFGDARFGSSWQFGYIVSTLFLFVLIPYFNAGQTIGKRLVKIRIVKVDGQPIGFWRLLWREFLLYGVAFPITWVFNNQLVLVMSDWHQSDLTYVLLIGSGIATIYFVVNIVWEIMTRHGRFFYDVWAKTKQVSTVAIDGDDSADKSKP